jgi:hypothetical protein
LILNDDTSIKLGSLHAPVPSALGQIPTPRQHSTQTAMPGPAAKRADGNT